MPGPTNAQVVTCPPAVDARQAIREVCVQQGCTCGRDLNLILRHVTRERKAEWYAAHLPGCPLLARAMGVN